MKKVQFGDAQRPREKSAYRSSREKSEPILVKQPPQTIHLPPRMSQTIQQQPISQTQSQQKYIYSESINQIIAQVNSQGQMIHNLKEAFKLQQQFQEGWESQIQDFQKENLQKLLSLERKLNLQNQEHLAQINQMANFQSIVSQTTQPSAEFSSYNTIKKQLQQFDNNMKKVNQQNTEKLQKQILSTLKFSKVRTEALEEKIVKLSNELAIDIQTMKKSSTNNNSKKQFSAVDGLIVTESGESLDLKKVVQKLDRVSSEVSNFKYEIQKCQMQNKNNQKSIATVLKIIYSQGPKVQTQPKKKKKNKSAPKIQKTINLKSGGTVEQWSPVRDITTPEEPPQQEQDFDEQSYGEIVDGEIMGEEFQEGEMEGEIEIEDEFQDQAQIFTDFEEQIKNDKNLKALHDTMQNFDDDAEESYNGGISNEELENMLQHQDEDYRGKSLKKGLDSLSSLKYGID